RRDERVEQPRLAVGSRAEGAQMPRRDPVARERLARDRDVDVDVRVAALAALGARLEQAEVLELAGARRLDAGALAQLVQVEALVGLADRAALAPLLARAGGELLADHAQRQELVALKAEDRLEPLDVVLVEHAVAALGAFRRQQPLILEIPDLRDRDVGELRLQ